MRTTLECGVSGCTSTCRIRDPSSQGELKYPDASSDPYLQIIIFRSLSSDPYDSHSFGRFPCLTWKFLQRLPVLRCVNSSKVPAPGMPLGVAGRWVSQPLEATADLDGRVMADSNLQLQHECLGIDSPLLLEGKDATRPEAFC